MRISEASKVDTYIHKQVVSLIKMEILFDFKIRKSMPSVGDFWTYLFSISNLVNHGKCLWYDHICCDHHETWRSRASIMEKHAHQGGANLNVKHLHQNWKDSILEELGWCKVLKFIKDVNIKEALSWIW